jgi:hypothetical protein
MTIYYVDGYNGDNGNTGTVYTDAWRDLQFALDSVSAGDTIRFMNTAILAPATTIDVDQTSGTETAPIWIQAADSNGDPLTSGYSTLNGSIITSNPLVSVEAAMEYYRWTRIRFTNSDSGNGIENATAITATNWEFNNCRFDNHGADGVVQNSNYWSFNLCEFDNNSGNGYSGQYARGEGTGFFGCKFHDNAAYGAYFYSKGYVVYSCQFYDNGSSGLMLYRYSLQDRISNCVFFGNTSHGIEFGSSSLGSELSWIYNNVFRSNGGYGIYVNSSTYYFNDSVIDYNHFSNNTTNAVYWTDSAGYAEGDINGNGFGDNNTSGDPKFTSETDGSEDFTPLYNSPLIGGGYNYLNQGCIGHDVDYPAIEDVESGVSYANGELTGTLNVSGSPNAPSISVSVSGTTATVTVDGDALATNYVLYASVGTESWSAGGNRVGDGTVDVAGLTKGQRYVFVAYSVSTADVDSGPSDPVYGYVSEDLNSIESAIYYILSNDSTVSGIVGTSVYPNNAPQTETTPYIVYDQIGGERGYTLGTPSPDGLVECLLQVSCYAGTPASARLLSNAVRSALSGYSGTASGVSIKLIMLDAEGDTPYFDNELESQDIYAKRLDFRMYYAE